ncbi:MAG: acetylglutamate kinase [Armatimonadetes bacterium]|nr:acetylglutamate kinase [Armatimonadota bacterium]
MTSPQISSVVDFSSIRSAFPYIKTFRGKRFVFKLGGELCENKATLRLIMEQIALLSMFGIKVLIVHGGGKHATELGERLGYRSAFVSGRRVTSEEMIEVAKMSFAGVLNSDLVASMNSLGIPALGISGVDFNLVQAHRRPPVKIHDDRVGEEREVDFGFVADVDGINSAALETLLSLEAVPIVASLVAEDDGTILNINADTLATELAKAMGASKLIQLTAVDGVMSDLQDPGSLISVLTMKEAEAMMSDPSVSGGMIPKLKNAVAALEGGVDQVHIISGTKQDAILQEIFTNEGSGTMIMG